ncbi:hypothetical protein J5U23_02904 [Saccharolobus shibatae B12]|uniref:Uncharacterized protein n=1 Tax=Saccharolobus shibatae (strain ATCC 51178 / DSM 5389 / JCM 8931 / NBRC 15437 / B12) TaxID=523848 RepID=A0A8F5GUI9_SACSH|nr:hypothetical protein [Saccharolobus shibatae]QXJ27122.1 hypothetical protein J5U23_p2904 [Saccharolobus shibatae B12]QXJ30015.1 hypothetical protein J5U23_02904 [Saccharolobus shibatae B12]
MAKDYRSGSMWALGLAILVLLFVYLLPYYSSLGQQVTIQPPPTVTQPKPINITSHPIPQQNYTVVYSAPNISTLLEVPASLLSNYTIQINGNSNLLAVLLKALSLNASEISPEDYQKFLQIASVLYSHVTNYSPTPIINNVIIFIPSNVTFPTSFPTDWSYPPSDLVTLNSPVYSIIDMYPVTLTMSVTYSTNMYLAHSSTSQNGNQTIINRYYGMKVWGTVYLLANNNVIASNNFQISYEAVPNYELPYPGAPIYQNTFQISGDINVPPGVPETVYLQYTITAYQYTKTTTSGNVTYINHYPTDPSFNYQEKTYNWYDYSITIPITIEVFNGTNPTTEVGNNIYNTRDISTYFSYTTWSSEPQPNSTIITTYDHINIVNYSIKRTWNAGSIEVIPQEYTQQNGNTINYYLSFNVQNNLVQPPSWIYQKMNENVTVKEEWYNFLNLVAFAYTLYHLANGNLTAYDYYVSMATFYNGNSTSGYYKMYNDSLTLFSVFSPWNITKGILDLTGVGVWNSIWYYVKGLQIINTSFYGLLDSNNQSWLIYDPVVVYATYYNEEPLGFQFTSYPNYNFTPVSSILEPFPQVIEAVKGIYYSYPLPYTIFTFDKQIVNFKYYYNPTIDKVISL